MHWRPGDDFDNAINLVVGRRTGRAARKHQVDWVDETRQWLGQIGRLELAQSFTQSTLTTIYTDILHYALLYRTVLWCCWLGGRKGIRPVKKLEWWGTGKVICLERDANLHMAQLMTLPFTVCCFSKIQIGFTFLVPAHPGSPGKRAVKRECVCITQDNFHSRHSKFKARGLCWSKVLLPLCTLAHLDWI